MMFDEIYYSQLGQSLADLHANVDWCTIFYCADIEDNVVGQFMYFSSTDKSLYQWNALYKKFGLRKSDSDVFLDRASDIVRNMNNAYAANGQERWTILTFILNNDGSFHTDLSYESLDDTSEYDRRQLWKEKYLPKDHTLIL